MFGVGGVNAVTTAEVQAAHDTNALGHVPMHAADFAVARCADQGGVKLLVQLAHHGGVCVAFGHRHQPNVFECIQFGWVVWRSTQFGHAGQLQGDAQVVKLVELGEVQRFDEPAGFGFNVQEAFVAQAKECFSHGCAAHTQTLSDLGLREPVTWDQAEVVDLGLQLNINLVGQVAARRGVHGKGRHQWWRSGGRIVHRTECSNTWGGQQTHVRRHHTPACGRAHPGLALAARFVAALASELGVGGGEVVAIGGDDGVSQLA